MPRISSKIVEVVIFRKKDVPEFLVLKRADNDRIYPGLWQLVSGGIKRGEKAHEAAIREVNEEIGVKPKRFYNTPLTNTFYFFTNDAVNLSPVFAAEVDGSTKVKLSGEHKEFQWLKKEDAISLLVWPGQKEAISVVNDYILNESPSRKFMEIKIR
ncbi:MAG TPA: NUDIX pyrophosphatase [Candidatus Acidoferrales bacterium]|nr:NUDIX pyrophosphatase [Candidatus Acidoferrales bacterium]